MLKKKVLIFYTSVGLGHKSIAENIGSQLLQAGLEVRLEDVGKVQSGKFQQAVVSVHKFVNNYLPFVWQWLYTWGHYIVYPFRVFISGFNSREVEKILQSYNPDLVITTQTTASAVISYLKNKNIYKGKFGVAFSDYHFHPYWVYPNVDFYLANIVEQKEAMIQRGVPAEKIFVCGMTLKPKLTVDVTAVKQKLIIKPNENIILVGSGSLGTGMSEELLKQLSKVENTKVLVVCGKNESYKTYLEKKFANTNILPLGFYSSMEELYSIASIFFTKPGGLSVAEALQYNLPIIITHTLPGQEQLNLKYLLEKGLVNEKSVSLPEQITKAQNLKQDLLNNPNLQAIINPELSAKAGVLKILT